MLKYTGLIKLINATQQVSEKFRKREFVITDDAQSYPQFIQFQMTQDRVDSLENVHVGDEVEVSFLLKGREWKNPHGEIKYFNSLEAYSIVKIQDGKFKGEKMVPTPDQDLPF